MDDFDDDDMFDDHGDDDLEPRQTQRKRQRGYVTHKKNIKKRKERRHMHLPPAHFLQGHFYRSNPPSTVRLRSAQPAVWTPGSRQRRSMVFGDVTYCVLFC